MFKDDITTICNVHREDENLADLVEEIATSALRGVQLDVRFVYCTARQSFGSKFPKILDLVYPNAGARSNSTLNMTIGVQQKTNNETDK